MNELDRDTEMQIEKLVDDFRTKIIKIVLKNTNKLLKEQAKNFKDLKINASPIRKQTKSSTNLTNKLSSIKTKKRNYDSDDDSD